MAKSSFNSKPSFNWFLQPSPSHWSSKLFVPLVALHLHPNQTLYGLFGMASARLISSLGCYPATHHDLTHLPHYTQPQMQTSNSHSSRQSVHVHGGSQGRQGKWSEGHGKLGWIPDSHAQLLPQNEHAYYWLSSFHIPDGCSQACMCAGKKIILI